MRGRRVVVLLLATTIFLSVVVGNYVGCSPPRPESGHVSGSKGIPGKGFTPTSRKNNAGRKAGGGEIGEILVMLDTMIGWMDDKSLEVSLTGSNSEMMEMLDALREGHHCLRKARASYERASQLMEKGYGKLVGPEQ